MSITLSPKAEQFIEAEIAAGHVQSGDEVIDEALELYRHRRAYIEAQIDEGLADVEAGRSRPSSPQMLADIKQAALQMKAARQAENG